MAIALDKHDTVIFPRYRLEEGLVDIQAASEEASAWIDKGWAHLPIELQSKEGPHKAAFAAAHSLVQLIGHDAHRLAGEVSTCPDGRIEPSHGNAA